MQDGPAPREEQLSRLAGISRAGPRQVETPVEDSLAPWADQIYQWLTGDRLKVTRIQELLAARGCVVSYTSLRRFIRKRNWGRRSVRTVRMADTDPGEVAEADFGRLGMITDPVLVQALEQEAMPQLPLALPPGRFARPGSVFVFAFAAGGRS